jgi:hypothetical protein
MECQHEPGMSGKCEICGTFARHGRTDERTLSGAREDGDSGSVPINNSEHGETRSRKGHSVASVAVQGNGKPKALTKLDLHQTEKEQAVTKSRKRRRRKAK